MKSLSEAAGLQAGDTILAVNGKDLTSLRHKEAQEAIVKSGNNFSLTIVRYISFITIVILIKEIIFVVPQSILKNNFLYHFRGAGAGGGNRPLTAQQGAGGWKPDVKPVGAMPTQPSAPGQTFTQTSLAKNIPVWFPYCVDIFFVFLIVLNTEP